jgi:DNA-binding transcriptional regulator YhcF (GntR family)
MTMVVFDPDSSVPPFQQIREQIAAAIEDGRLQPAVRLPPVRQLAADLGLAANTVARSYRELELEGVLETRGRHGTFVSSGPSPTRKLAARDAKKFVRRMRELGVGNEEALAIIRREIEQFGGRPTAQPKPAR